MSEPKRCEDCKHSIGMHWHGYRVLFCTHEKLTTSSNHVKMTYIERDRWFGKCGRAGKLWEAKP